VGICQVEQPSGRFLMVNNSLVRSTGYSREELLRMTFWDITPPEWHEAERQEARKQHLDTNFGPYEKEYRRKDGSCYPLLVSGTHMRDSLGRHIGWAIVQDISERKAMELQLAATDSPGLPSGRCSWRACAASWAWRRMSWPKPATRWWHASAAMNSWCC
jgi:PAS domain S-box-containing protein